MSFWTKHLPFLTSKVNHFQKPNLYKQRELVYKKPIRKENGIWSLAAYLYCCLHLFSFIRFYPVPISTHSTWKSTDLCFETDLKFKLCLAQDWTCYFAMRIQARSYECWQCSSALPTIPLKGKTSSLTTGWVRITEQEPRRTQRQYLKRGIKTIYLKKKCWLPSENHPASQSTGARGQGSRKGNSQGGSCSLCCWLANGCLSYHPSPPISG